MRQRTCVGITIIGASAFLLAACSKQGTPSTAPGVPAARETSPLDPTRFLTQPLVTEIHTADPSAHMFNGRIWIYGSHDIESGDSPDTPGGQFAMHDYRPIEVPGIGFSPVIHPVALDIKDVPWAQRQMWAPDAAERNGKYYLYFPARDRQDVFRIGVAVGDNPAGPFKARAQAIRSSYSTDPTVFRDDDGKYYLYFGGLQDGQLQRWKSGGYKADDESQPADDQPALLPRVARLTDDMLELTAKPQEVQILDENGRPLLSRDHDRRFFGASWMHKYRGNYYFSYSTGDTRFIAYAMGKSPDGPFTYKGSLLLPVLGSTTQHSITEVGGKWYIFYHDSQVSKGAPHLRNIKQPIEISYNEDGSIQPIDPWFGDAIPNLVRAKIASK